MSEVSVCIPVYNGERFLKQSVESVLTQDYPDFELIIVDDASTDKSADIIRSFDDSRLKFYQNPVSKGIPGNWNIVMERACGRYIKFLFQDDVLYPNCLSTMIEPMKAHQNIGMVFSRRDVVTEDSMRADQFYPYMTDLQTPLKQKIPSGMVLKGLDFLQTCLKAGGTSINPIAEPSFVMFDAGLISRLGCFDTRLKQNVDYDYWFRLLLISDAFFIDKPLGCFRLHRQSASAGGNSLLTKLSYIREERIIMENLMELAMGQDVRTIQGLLKKRQRWFYLYRVRLLISQQLKRISQNLTN